MVRYIAPAVQQNHRWIPESVGHFRYQEEPLRVILYHPIMICKEVIRLGVFGMGLLMLHCVHFRDQSPGTAKWPDNCQLKPLVVEMVNLEIPVLEKAGSAISNTLQESGCFQSLHFSDVPESPGLHPLARSRERPEQRERTDLVEQVQQAEQSPQAPQAAQGEQARNAMQTEQFGKTQALYSRQKSARDFAMRQVGESNTNESRIRLRVIFEAFPRGKHDSDYLEIEPGHYSVRRLSQIALRYTFGILPIYQKVERTLTFELWQDHRLIGSYIYTSSFHEIFGLPGLLLYPFEDGNDLNQDFKGITLRFLQDVKNNPSILRNQNLADGHE